MKILTVVSFAFLAFTFGCKSSNPNSPQVVTGDLKGSVGLYDPHGNEVTDRSGVLVQAEGTSFSAISDASGNWIIHDLPAQNYSIRFSKSGYGTVKNTSYSFAGVDTVSYGSRVYLYQPIQFIIILDSASAGLDTIPSYGNFGYLSGHISGAIADSAIVQAYVFFGKSANIIFGDTSTYLGGLLWDNSRPIPLTKRGNDFYFETKNWEVCGPDGWVRHGMTVYLQGFAMSTKYSPRYYDGHTGTWVYPNTPPSSNILSVKIP